MKIKEQFLTAFALKQLQVPECGNYYRGRNLVNKIYELETEDFDKAIQLMMLNNKKAGVKEFTLLKEEFQSLTAEGKKLNVDDYDPIHFVDKIEETATKRLSDVEKRKVKKQIKSWWDLNRLQESAENINTFFTRFTKQVDYADKIKQLEVLQNMQNEFWKDRTEWMTTQVDENEATLDTLDASDWEEMLDSIKFYDENMKEFRYI
tara:strand:+ start:197 stop:814 length:618 start_codon:yes stop_codon:yes gene_type:complete